VTAHHGIIPTLEPANLSAMSEKERAVYRLIRAHYLAQFLPHHEFDRTVADLSCGQQKLVATGKQVVVKGWRLVLAEPEREGSADEDGDAPARSQVLPALRDGMACQIAGTPLLRLRHRRRHAGRPRRGLAGIGN
jgi:DNA topoisomerase-3